MTLKIELAHRMVAELHSNALADAAQKDFAARFQTGDLTSSTMPVFETKQKSWNPIELLVETTLAASKSEARRLIDQKAVELDGKIITKTSIPLVNGGILKVGKKKFLKIKLS